ncbi:FHA domain-containing protein [Geopsychrobacter electrodiphilus]|uniref:FHA domain-containing protein n=1 Tax=Geopsychrobacter electrodiphilus TaxID=225196 RepID=UPI00036472D1|nr:FHA domain-containing protein [Geopsychrobacter electrodiphilus]
MLKITLQLGDKLLATYETDNDDLSIGRSASNDIRIDNLAVSSQHAKIRKVMNTYLIEDLKSTNGTFVNEKQIDRYELIDGDRVTIGKHSLLFSISGGSKKPPFDADKTMILDTEKQRELLDKNR